jgi:hypothetical protein
VKHIRYKPRMVVNDKSKTPGCLGLEETIRVLTIEKQSALVQLYQLQEQKFLTLRELATLNEPAMQESVNLCDEHASDEQPWEPVFSDINSYSCLNIMRRISRRNQSRSSAIAIKSGIFWLLDSVTTTALFVYIYPWHWICTQLCQSNLMLDLDLEDGQAERRTPSSPSGSHSLGELADQIVDTECGIHNLWDKAGAIEETMEVCIQQISQLLHEEYAPPYRTLAEFREYIAAARGSERRAGRPSLLFSAAPPMLRGSFSRGMFVGPAPSPAKVRTSQPRVSAQAVGQALVGS